MTARDLPLDGITERINKGDRLADNTLHAMVSECRAALALREELAEADRTRDMLASICKRTAVALKGPEPDMGLHDWSDLPEVARKAVAELAEVSAELKDCEKMHRVQLERVEILIPQLAECRAKLAQAEQAAETNRRALLLSEPESGMWKLERDLAAAQANVRGLREELEELHAVTMHPHCKDTPEGHIAYESIQRARGRAFKALARPADDSALREMLTKACDEKRDSLTIVGDAYAKWDESTEAIVSRLLGGGK